MSSRSDQPPEQEQIPILIVGGSLVGLSTAMFLGWHGISSLVVERHNGTAIHPRAGHFHLRTIELFRSVAGNCTAILVTLKRVRVIGRHTSSSTTMGFGYQRLICSARISSCLPVRREVPGTTPRGTLQRSWGLKLIWWTISPTPRADLPRHMGFRLQAR